GKEMAKLSGEDFLYNKGMFARAFPVKDEPYKNRIAETTISGDIVDVSDNFSVEFHNTGIMRNGEVTTIHTIPVEETATPLREVIEESYDEKYVIDGEKLEKFKYLRGQKKEKRTAKNGHEYFYTEGGMSESDSLDLPGRTMLTSEGSVNR